jgi:membrane protein
MGDLRAEYGPHVRSVFLERVPVGLIETFRRKITSLLTSPAEELGRWARFARYQIQLWRFCARRLRENDAQAMSSALSFRTLFAMVPTLVLALVLLRAVGALEGTALVDRLLEATGLSEITLAHSATATTTAPAISLADEIRRLVGSVERKLTLGVIGPVGVLLLVWSATTLMTTMERSLNRVFGAPKPRALWRRVLMYWSALTLGPMVIVAAIYVGEQLLVSAGQVPWLSWLLASVGWAGPVVVQLVVLTMLYRLVPNKTISFRAALGGAIVAGPLWLLAKWGFKLYVVASVARGNLYGTLGLLPLFLIWVNLSWWIFLFGAELAHVAVNLGRMTAAHEAGKILLTSMDLLATASVVWREHEQGRGPAALTKIEESVHLPDECIRSMADRLVERGLLCAIPSAGEDDTWTPARPAGQVSVGELLEGLPAARATSRPYEPEIAKVVATARERSLTGLGDLSLGDLLRQGATD